MDARVRVVVATLGVACAVLLASSAALAQIGGSPDEQARTRFEAGRAAYDAGRFEDALREFRAAYELSPRPLLLYNIYLAALDLGEIRDAADALRRYLATDAVEASERPPLEARLHALTDRIAREDAERSGGPGSGGTGDGGGSQDGSGGQRGGGGSGGSRGGGVPTLTWVSWGVGAAAAVTAVVTGIMALDRQSTLDGGCDPAGTDGVRVCPENLRDTASSGETLALVTDISIGVAIVGAAVGTIVLLTAGGGDDARADAPRRSRARRAARSGAGARVLPTFGPGRAGVAAELHF